MDHDCFGLHKGIGDDLNETFRGGSKEVDGRVGKEVAACSALSASCPLLFLGPGSRCTRVAARHSAQPTSLPSPHGDTASCLPPLPRPAAQGRDVACSQPVPALPPAAEPTVSGSPPEPPLDFASGDVSVELASEFSFCSWVSSLPRLLYPVFSFSVVYFASTPRSQHGGLHRLLSFACALFLASFSSNPASPRAELTPANANVGACIT